MTVYMMEWMTESGRLGADEKPGVNNTIWVDKSVFFRSQNSSYANL